MRTYVLSILAIATLALSGCEELENICGIGEEDISFAEDYNKHLNAAIFIYNTSDLALRDSTLAATGTAQIDGATCTRTPDSLIVDFGNGTIGADGTTRYGSYRMGFIGNYGNSGSLTFVKLINYKEGDLPYTGMVTLKNTTSGASPEIEVIVGNLSADSLNLDGNVQADWISGFETQTNANDDAYSLSGSLTLSNTSNSESFTGKITTPLHIEYSCNYTMVGGMLTLEPSNTDKYPEVSVDFIDGDCANLFTTTLDCEGNQLSFSYPIK